jgi:putative peptide zinc metalloprotease protein
LKVNKKIQDIELIRNNENYMALYNEKYFSVSKLFYEILEELKNDSHEKKKFINTHGISEMNYEELAQIVSEKVDDIVKKAKPTKNYIFFALNIFSEKKVIFLSKYLSIFFKKSIFRLLFPLVIVLGFVTYFMINTKYQNHSIFEMSLLDTFVVYFVVLIIMIFHEFGHSAASSSFNIKPKEIGFGFYILFPVLYSNVTRIWKLNKTEKVVVNLGGIYFQGIINILFLIFLIFNKDDNHVTYLVLLIVKANLFVMVYSLFPFVRNDGYWIVSDYSNILNLNKKSYSYIFDLVKNKEKINYYLLSYSIGQYLFILYLGYKYLPSIPKNISKFYLYLKEHGFIYLIINDFGLFFKFIFSLLIGFVVISTLLRFIVPFFKKDNDIIKPVIAANN